MQIWFGQSLYDETMKSLTKLQETKTVDAPPKKKTKKPLVLEEIKDRYFFAVSEEQLEQRLQIVHGYLELEDSLQVLTELPEDKTQHPNSTNSSKDAISPCQLDEHFFEEPNLVPDKKKAANQKGESFYNLNQRGGYDDSDSDLSKKIEFVETEELQRVSKNVESKESIKNLTT